MAIKDIKILETIKDGTTVYTHPALTDCHEAHRGWWLHDRHLGVSQRRYDAPVTESQPGSVTTREDRP
jgi:hypothetical protein